MEKQNKIKKKNPQLNGSWEKCDKEIAECYLSLPDMELGKKIINV